jgi:hypothetical protein
LDKTKLFNSLYEFFLTAHRHLTTLPYMLFALPAVDMDPTLQHVTLSRKLKIKNVNKQIIQTTIYH